MIRSKNTTVGITKEEFWKVLLRIPHGADVVPGRRYVYPELWPKIKSLGFTARRLIDVLELGFDCLEHTEAEALRDLEISRKELDQFRDDVLTSEQKDVANELTKRGLSVEVARRLMLCTVEFLDDMSRKELKDTNLWRQIDDVIHEVSRRRKQATIARKFTLSMQTNNIESLNSFRQLSNEDSEIRDQIDRILADMRIEGLEKPMISITSDEYSQEVLTSLSVNSLISRFVYQRKTTNYTKPKVRSKLLESKYLRKHFHRALTLACLEVAEKKPKDPVELMGFFLRDYHAKKVARKKAKRDQRELDELRSKATTAPAVVSSEYFMYAPC